MQGNVDLTTNFKLIKLFIFQEDNCLYCFKSGADSEKHMKLIHDKVGREARPLGFPCNFIKTDGKSCGQVFESAWYLTKHKRQEVHFVPRKKK